MTSAAVVDDLSGAVDLEDLNPFPGPKPYRTDQAELFFGREGQIEELVSLVLSSRIVLVHAPSGYGKSSLLEAGLLPRLRSHDVVVLPTVRLGQAQGGPPGSDGEDHNPFLPLLTDALHGSDQEPSSARPTSSSAGTLLLLVIDQFEEVFLDPGLWQERADLLEHLRREVERDERLRVVIAMRSDFLADLLPHAAQLPNRLVVRLALESLDERAARRVIVEAFRRTEVQLRDDDVDRLLEVLLTLEPGVAGGRPVRAQHVNLIQLQILCRRLWDDLANSAPDAPSTRLLDLRASMRLFVDAAISGVARDTQTGEGIIRRWVEDNLITFGDRRAVLPVEEASAGGLPLPVVVALERARLVQIEQRNRTRWVELSHDSMVGAVEDSNARWTARRRRTRHRRTALAGLVVLVLSAAFVPLRVPMIDDGSGDRTYVDTLGPGPEQIRLPRGDVAGAFAVHGSLNASGADDALVRVTLSALGADGEVRRLQERTARLSDYQNVMFVEERSPSGTAAYLVDVETDEPVEYGLSVSELTERIVLSGSSRGREVELEADGSSVGVELEEGTFVRILGEDDSPPPVEVTGGSSRMLETTGALVAQSAGSALLLSQYSTEETRVQVQPFSAARSLRTGEQASLPVDEPTVVALQLDPRSPPSVVSTSCSAEVTVSVVHASNTSVPSYDVAVHDVGREPHRAAIALAVARGGAPWLLLERREPVVDGTRCNVRVEALRTTSAGPASPSR